MPRTIFDRQDFTITIDGPQVPDFFESIRDWRNGFPPMPYGYQRLWRIALDLTDPDLQAAAWEERLLREARGYADVVVRVSRVAPRVAGATLALPLRVLVAGAPELDVPGIIERVFGSHPPAVRDRAIVAEHQPDVSSLARPESWPTVDVLHFGSPVELEAISRVTIKWHTRLVVFDVHNESEAEEARRVGARLVGRGGPAVVVRRVTRSVDRFYERLIHDFPIDDLGAEADTIFGGQGREELLRVSTPGAELVETIGRAKNWDPGFVKFLHPKYREYRFISWDNVTEAYPMAAAPPIRPLRTITDTARHDDLTANLGEVSTDKALDEFAADWDHNWQYSLHEGDGVIPMLQGMDHLRGLTLKGKGGAAESAEEVRYVNASLWAERADRVVKVDAQRERLTICDPYQLRIQIGPKDEDVPVFLSSALFDDRLDWKPNENGRWVELGVTGAGFRIEGEPVQELWLPRHGESEPVYFAVTPVTSTPVLRYTIYCDGNILQTFRLAALAGEEATREELAKALDVNPEELPEGTYVTRLDFAGAALGDAQSLPGRTLSIVANHAEGERVITVKGAPFLLDNRPGNIAKLVGGVRDALFDNSVNRVDGLDRKDWQYAYGPNAADNAARFASALPALAEKGWALYQRLFSATIRGNIEKALDDAGETTIQVAHALLEDVIPWAAVYDRHYDAEAPEHALCLEAMPNDQGELPAKRCGELPSCPLHPNNLGGRNAEDVAKGVACPLRFWGFRHIVEVPPQQNTEGEAPPRRVTIRAGSSSQLSAGINGALPLAGSHLAKLDELLRRAAVWKHKSMERNEILKDLADSDLDVIYFYCHARGGMADPQFDPPCMEFQESSAALPGHLTAYDFDSTTRWPHEPLVFLNGCSTAAFSPDAISPFIVTFVRDRGASGVIGTEIPVHETLAGEVGFEFLDRFLAGVEAGEALRQVRRALLRKRNPAGLAYTLYACSELKLEHS